MDTGRPMLLAAAMLVLAAACSSDDTPSAPVTGPSLTAVPPIGTLPPQTPPTTVRSSPTRPPPSTTPPGEPKPGVERFVPSLPLEDGVLSLDVVFVDGSTSHVEWPGTLDLVSHGLIPYGWAFIGGGSSRDFFVRPGTIEDVLDQLGGADLVGDYPDGAGATIGLWRPANDTVDYLAFQFGGWTVLVYDYRNDLMMSDEDRALWAASFHGQESEAGFLVLTADYPLRLVFAGNYPAPLNMTLRGDNGEVKLTPGLCDPSVTNGIDSDAFVVWCNEDANMTVQAYGSRDFQQAVLDGLVIRSVVFAEPPPLPVEEEAEEE